MDYPFNLKGILYFPKLRQDFGGVAEGQIKMFSGQVFVADNIKEVIPEFLTLLKGVIDCPDLPLTSPARSCKTTAMSKSFRPISPAR